MRVVLPLPLRPTMPKNSPLLISTATSRSARSSSISRLRKGVQRTLLERVDLLVGEAERLRDAAHRHGDV